jgi:hypothetical protein
MQRLIRNGVLIIVLAAAALIVLRAENSGAGPVPPPQEGGESSLPEFQPSEELPADAAVAFPTDI